ncbi:MAG: hypothetical protein WBP40_05100, partial [Candidatus Moraniibacteriota bacterium]
LLFHSQQYLIQAFSLYTKAEESPYFPRHKIPSEAGKLLPYFQASRRLSFGLAGHNRRALAMS